MLQRASSMLSLSEVSYAWRVHSNEFISWLYSYFYSWPINRPFSISTFFSYFFWIFHILFARLISPHPHFPLRFDSFKPFCPLDFFQTEPFISYPLLSAISSRENTFARSNNKRSYEVNGLNSLNHFDASRDYETNDFTIEKPNGTAEIDGRIRLASIGLVAKNIFKDIVIRPIHGFAKLVQTARGVWESQMQ